jgi:cytidine deaminase
MVTIQIYACYNEIATREKSAIGIIAQLPHEPMNLKQIIDCTVTREIIFEFFSDANKLVQLLHLTSSSCHFHKLLPPQQDTTSIH